MRSPRLGVAACWALGIVLATALNLGLPAAIPLLVAAAAALVGSLAALRAKRAAPAVILAATGFVVAGALATMLFPHRFPPDNIRNLSAWNFDLEKPIPAEAIVESVPVRTPSGFQFDAEVRKVGNQPAKRATGKIVLRLKVPEKSRSWAAADALSLEAGDVILAPVRFYRPTSYRNPGGFDYRNWLESIQDVTWEGTIADPIQVQKLSSRGLPWVSAMVGRVRGRLLAGIDQLYPPWSAQGRDGAVLKAILLGDRSALDSATVESFRKSGLYHLLVISGLHVGLLAALALALFGWLGWREAWRGGGLLLLLAGYAMLVEQRAPTLRATLMIGLYLLARYLYRDREGLNAVGFAALILLVVRPPWLFEAGFQLSFSAALLIFAVVVPVLDRTTLPYARALGSIENVNRDIALAPRQAQFRLDLRMLIEFLKRKNSWLSGRPAVAQNVVIFPFKAVLWAVELTIFSAILQIGLLMPMAESFHRVTLAGIGLNTLAIPVMTVLLALAVPTVILAATVPPLAVIPGKLLAGVITILFALTNVPHLPLWLSYRVPSPPAWVAWGFGLAVVAVAWTLGRSSRLLAAAATGFAIFAALVAWYPFSPRIPKGKLEATALDCGRGQATFIVLPDGTTVLAGACGEVEPWSRGASFQGRWDPGEEIVSPYLWSLGLKRIDVLLADDSRPGALDGMAAVIRNFRPREFWETNSDAGRSLEELARTTRSLGLPIRRISAGSVLREGKATLAFLPAASGPGNNPPEREMNFAMRLSIKSGSVMLIDHLDEGIQTALAQAGAAAQSNVLETSGGRSALLQDQKLLEQISARIVVISGGEWSREIHAQPFEAIPINAKFLSTEKDGAITVDLSTSGLRYHADEAPADGASAAGTPSGSMAR